MTYIKVEVADVTIGNRKVQGMLFEDGRFGIGVVQLNEQLIKISKSNNVLSRNLKRLINKISDEHSIEKVKVVGVKQLLNAIDLNALEAVILELAIAGNKDAAALARELIGLSLTQLWADAFCIKFEVEERQEYLLARANGKAVRHTLTDEIQAWCYRSGIARAEHKSYYIHASEALNLFLFNGRASEIRSQRNVPANSLLRDYMSPTELREIEKFEDRVIEFMRLDNMTPHKAIQATIARLAKLRSTEVPLSV